MPKVAQERFRLIEPVVYWQVVLWLAAKLFRAALGMFKRMSHCYTSYVVVV